MRSWTGVVVCLLSKSTPNRNRGGAHFTNCERKHYFYIFFIVIFDDRKGDGSFNNIIFVIFRHFTWNLSAGVINIYVLLENLHWFEAGVVQHRLRSKTTEFRSTHSRLNWKLKNGLSLGNKCHVYGIEKQITMDLNNSACSAWKKERSKLHEKLIGILTTN